MDEKDYAMQNLLMLVEWNFVYVQNRILLYRVEKDSIFFLQFV